MSRQRGLFTADQAHAAGYPPGEIERLRSGGQILSVRRGVYAATRVYQAMDDLRRHTVDAQAALLCLKQPTTLSHETAAVWRGMPLLRPALGDVHVTRPELCASRREAGIYHHDGALPVGHVTELEGVRLTSDARTAVDIARRSDFACGLAATDSALRGGSSSEELQAVLAFCSSWPGARAASRALSAAHPGAANPGESWSRAVLIELGLEPTDVQFAVYDDQGLAGYADVAWRDRWTLGEFDGRLKYAVPPGADPETAARVVWEEKRREDRFRQAGWHVVRWGWTDLRHPPRLAAWILGAFARADAQHRMAT